MTEPRKNNLSIAARPNESIRVNKNLVRNSTSRKSNLFRQSLRNSLRRLVKEYIFIFLRMNLYINFSEFRRSRAVSNLFPTTPSRQMIEDSLQNDETIDWQNASTSSVLVPDQLSHNDLTSDNPDSKLDRYMSVLIEKLKPIVADKLKHDPNLKMLK